MGFADQVRSMGPIIIPSKSDDQKKKNNKQGTKAQIDLVFDRFDRTITICEIKFAKAAITPEIIPEIENKKSMIIPYLQKGITIELALISLHGPDKSLQSSQYFHHILNIEDLLN